MELTEMPLSQLSENVSNPRTITDTKLERLVESILVFPRMLSLRPIVVDENNVLLGGNMRFRALSRISSMKFPSLEKTLSGSATFTKKTEFEREQLLDYWRTWLRSPVAPVSTAASLSSEERREFIIKDNVGFGEWDTDALSDDWSDIDFDEWGLDGLWSSEEEELGTAERVKDGGAENGSLNDRFIVPPFSILDTRKGYWQARKKMWREKIGDMGESRKDTLITSDQLKYKDIYTRSRKQRKELGVSFKEYLEKYVSEEEKANEESKVLSAGVSLFDPVLSEILCRWFTPRQGAKIFDCFAGDTQKGLVFCECGFAFKGVELRQEQVDINNKVLANRDLQIEYVCDDGRNVCAHFEENSQDLLFSCPPYYDLEVYSNQQNDASNQKTYEEFIDILDKAFKSAYTCLKENRFAVIVVGDVRAKKTGAYYDFPGDIKRIFREAGAYLYNEMILIETGASTAIRASTSMKTRKVAKQHQNVLVFYKGNPREITKHFPPIELSKEEEETLDDLIAQTTAVEGDD